MLYANILYDLIPNGICPIINAINGNYGKQSLCGGQKYSEPFSMQNLRLTWTMITIRFDVKLAIK